MNLMTYTISFLIALYAGLDRLKNYVVVFFPKVKTRHQSLKFFWPKFKNKEKAYFNIIDPEILPGFYPDTALGFGIGGKFGSCVVRLLGRPPGEYRIFPSKVLSLIFRHSLWKYALWPWKWGIT